MLFQFSNDFHLEEGHELFCQVSVKELNPEIRSMREADSSSPYTEREQE